MSPTFTDDDVGKAVVTDAGANVGEVTDVEGETASVEPDPGIADSIAAALDWGETSDRPLPLAGDAVAEIDDETIRLEGEYSTDRNADSASGEGHGATAESGDASGAGTGDVNRESDASEFGQDETDADAGALAEDETGSPPATRQDETDAESGDHD